MHSGTVIHPSLYWPYKKVVNVSHREQCWGILCYLYLEVSAGLPWCMYDGPELLLQNSLQGGLRHHECLGVAVAGAGGSSEVSVCFLHSVLP